MSSRPRQPRYHKLQELQAHNPTVTCCSIGRKSMGVVVTGGDDKLVNLWTIGTHKLTLSLSGHTTSVESVAFDSTEEAIVAGSAGGVIKVFDLSKSQAMQTYSAHKCHVRSVYYKGYEVVSGSNDTNIKLFDTRQKVEARQFRGHTAPVVKVHMSPDNRYIGSGDEAGNVKWWDKTAGKVYKEFAGHTHAVTGLMFNPRDMVLATASADRTVKLWEPDLPGPDTTPPETTGIRAMTYHPDGRHLFAAVQDGLRVWHWTATPCEAMDFVDVPWTKVNDIAMMTDKNRLIGCSFSSGFVGVWMVDINKVIFKVDPDDGIVDTAAVSPYTPGAQPGLNGVQMPPLEQPVRRNAQHPRAAQAPAVNAPVAVNGASPQALNGINAMWIPTDAPYVPREAPANAPVPMATAFANDGVATYNTQLQLEQERFRREARERQQQQQDLHNLVARRAQGQYTDASGQPLGPLAAAQAARRTPSPSYAGAESPATPGMQVTPQDVTPPGVHVIRPNSAALPPRGPSPTSMQQPIPVYIQQPAQVPQPLLLQQTPQHVPVAYQQPPIQHVVKANHRSRQGSDAGQQTVPASQQTRAGVVSVGVGVGDSLFRPSPDPVAMQTPQQPQSVDITPPGRAAHCMPIQTDQVEYNAHKVESPEQVLTPVSEGEQLADALAASEASMQVISTRASTLRTMKSLLRKGDLKGALVAGRRAPDAVPVADVIAALMSRRGFGDMLGLDAVPDIVPVLESILSLPTQKHRMVGLDLALLVCKSFGPTIKDVCSVAVDKRMGVDMAFEQRRAKCEAARLVLQGLQAKLGMVKMQCQGKNGALSYRIAELSQQLEDL